MTTSRPSLQDKRDDLLHRERTERAAASRARTSSLRDQHVMRAERYADIAWALIEASDLPYIPSGLWK